MGNKYSLKKHKLLVKPYQAEEKRNKQTIFQLISQRTNPNFLVVNIEDTTRLKIILGQVKNRKMKN